jgi:hypothetical protein
MKSWYLALVILAAYLITATGVRADDEFSFESSEFEKKPFQLDGYLEIQPGRAWLNQDGSFYKLNYYNREQRDTLDWNTTVLRINGQYSLGVTSVNLRGYLAATQDSLGSSNTQRFDEAYISFKPDPGFTLDIGKVALQWGKGYAWNPVGFVQRPKDPNDVELARQGYSMAVADIIHNMEGDLKTIAFTPVIMPVSASMNSDFGQQGHVNLAGKLYLLYKDTDIDFTYLGTGSKTPRLGFDFSRNLGSNLEIHGEWARINDNERRTVSPTGAIRVETNDATNYLLGLRYLSENDTTTILEYYRNGAGYSEAQAKDFFSLVDAGIRQFEGTETDALLSKAALASQAGYGRSNPMQQYLYLRVSQKEPFDMLYFTPSLTTIVNVDDKSFSLTPEMLYTGITNLELRLRAVWLNGGAGTEFGEKLSSRRLELRARFYF